MTSSAILLERMFSLHKKKHPYCPICGHPRSIVSDSLMYNGAYVVREQCDRCEWSDATHYDASFTARTAASLRREQGTQ